MTKKKKNTGNLCFFPNFFFCMHDSQKFFNYEVHTYVCMEFLRMCVEIQKKNLVLFIIE